MRNPLLDCLLVQLGKSELSRAITAWAATGLIPDQEAKAYMAQLDSLTPENCPLIPTTAQGESKRRGPGRPRKDAAAPTPNGDDTGGVDLGAIAAGQ
jgi:hypothetical protein